MERLDAKGQDLVIANLRIARILAKRFRHKVPRDEGLASAYYGICKAALADPDSPRFYQFAWASAHNQIINDAKRFRRCNIRSARIWYGLRVQPESHHRGPYDLAADHSDRAWLGSAINRLGEPKSSVAALRQAGLTVEQIATELEKSIGWTSQQLSAAVRILRAMTE